MGHECDQIAAFRETEQSQRIFTVLTKKKNCQCKKRASSCAPPHLSAHAHVAVNGAVLTWASGGPPSSLMSSRWLWPSTTISFLKRPPAGSKRQTWERHENGVRRGDWWWWFVFYGSTVRRKLINDWLISAKWFNDSNDWQTMNRGKMFVHTERGSADAESFRKVKHHSEFSLLAWRRSLLSLRFLIFLFNCLQ